MNAPLNRQAQWEAAWAELPSMPRPEWEQKHWKLLRAFQHDGQFDAEREAEQQGLTTANYLRGI